MVSNKDIDKSDTEIETYQSIEELKFPQKDEKNSIIILDDLNQKEMDDPRVQAMFKKKYAAMVISITYKPNNFGDVINLY